jgi:ribonucleoside-triphosphate reductase
MSANVFPGRKIIWAAVISELENSLTDTAPSLFLKACRTTAKALFPNFMFLDTPFNQHEKWDASDPKRYRYELAI